MINKHRPGTQLLLQIGNAHSASCGAPLRIEANDNYVGYFENVHGEQWTLVGDRKERVAYLRGGDVGWDSAYKISADNPRLTVVLNEEEACWLCACLAIVFNVSVSGIAAAFEESRPPKRVIAKFTGGPDDGKVCDSKDTVLETARYAVFVWQCTEGETGRGVQGLSEYARRSPESANRGHIYRLEQADWDGACVTLHMVYRPDEG